MYHDVIMLVEAYLSTLKSAVLVSIFSSNFGHDCLFMVSTLVPIPNWHVIGSEQRTEDWHHIYISLGVRLLCKDLEWVSWIFTNILKATSYFWDLLGFHKRRHKRLNPWNRCPELHLSQTLFRMSVVCHHREATITHTRLIFTACTSFEPI